MAPWSWQTEEHLNRRYLGRMEEHLNLQYLGRTVGHLNLLYPGSSSTLEKSKS